MEPWHQQPWYRPSSLDHSRNTGLLSENPLVDSPHKGPVIPTAFNSSNNKNTNGITGCFEGDPPPLICGAFPYKWSVMRKHFHVMAPVSWHQYDKIWITDCLYCCYSVCLTICAELRMECNWVCLNNEACLLGNILMHLVYFKLQRQALKLHIIYAYIYIHII